MKFAILSSSSPKAATVQLRLIPISASNSAYNRKDANTPPPSSPICEMELKKWKFVECYNWQWAVHLPQLMEDTDPFWIELECWEKRAHPINFSRTILMFTCTHSAKLTRMVLHWSPDLIKAGPSSFPDVYVESFHRRKVYTCSIYKIFCKPSNFQRIESSSPTLH